MLGKTVKVKVTKPCNYFDVKTGIRYLINYGIAEARNEKRILSSVPIFSELTTP